MKRRRINIQAIILFVFGLMLTLNVQAQQPGPNESLKNFLATMQYIRMYYVDSIDDHHLIENAIVETLKELDPHSSYISKEDIQRANEPIEGSFEGIGITFQIYKDTILVIAPVPGGPSDKLGILAGDKIVKIEGEEATGDKINNQYVMDRLRGKKGTIVNISIFRKGRDELLDFDIVRDKIPLNSVDATFMATPEIGFIKLNRFSKSTPEEIKESLQTLKGQGMKKLILDLRGNPGGLMYGAIEIADHFLPEGKMIVYTKGLRSYPREFKATSRGIFEEGDLVVMINEGSASASEIVAGAVQDWDRGVIIGRRSFGKGLVQQPFRLPDSSFLRLTTAKYYTPTGRCIQRPYEEGSEEYFKDLLTRLRQGELVHADSIRFPDSLKYFTPSNRVVYGGGGIMPDIFTPWDSTLVTDYFTDLVRKGVFNEFVLNYVNDNRQELTKKYAEFTDFKKKFEVSDEMISGFVELGKEREIEPDEQQLQENEDFIKSRIKALMARNIWEVGSFYEIILEIDDEYHKAIEILENGETREVIKK